MTNVLIVSLPEYPLETSGTDMNFARTVGDLAFKLGIFSLIFVISASGWLHSRRLGFATTIIGIMGLILILLVS